MTRPTDQTDEFEPPSPGSWGFYSLAETNHESAHALAAHVLGLKVLEVRIDKPMSRTGLGPDPLGQCTTEKVTGEERWKQMLVDLAPAIVEGRCPERPPSLDNSERGDEFSAAVICYEEEIDEAQYRNYIKLLESLLKTPTARKKGLALGRELLEHGALRGSEVDRIFAEVEAETYGKSKASTLDEDN